MTISGNTFFLNNTFRFIFPIMRMYGTEYMSHMSSLYKQGIFIDDMEHPNMSNTDNLYVVVNTNMSNSLVQDIKFFDRQPYLSKRYIYSVRNTTKVPDRIILMLELPNKYNRVFERFTKGRYDMYSVEDVEKYFVETVHENAPFFKYCRNVLLRKRIENPPKLKDEILGM